MTDKQTTGEESWDYPPHENWGNAAQILNDKGWFSEYSGVPFFARAFMRKNREKILHKLAQDADLKAGSLSYLETTWSGAAGWAICHQDFYSSEAAEIKLEAEIREGNRDDL
ncbi:hypothetical protein [Gluconobacter kondonii]|uniref:Uncharacterized protein n=1 Tax=Gluconobacter kondonii TaxID=941463 RepID=A0ABQ5WWG4_9PROT|nr:hypothetical protein [Gluconobacter kondonii]GBR36699.1 hypothetical protein AA3266_2448 [Gluconobacter kondonii NBRC 3266]GLQ67382.1 hypothetical protein GCM10007870_29670 [Gluconobacter kondonii]